MNRTYRTLGLATFLALTSSTPAHVQAEANPVRSQSEQYASTCSFKQFGQYTIGAQKLSIDTGVSITTADVDGDGDIDVLLAYAKPRSFTTNLSAGADLTFIICRNDMPQKSTK